MACCRQQTRYYAVEAIHPCTVFYLHLHSMRWIAFLQPIPQKLSGVSYGNSLFHAIRRDYNEAIAKFAALDTRHFRPAAVW